MDSSSADTWVETNKQTNNNNISDPSAEYQNSAYTSDTVTYIIPYTNKNPKPNSLHTTHMHMCKHKLESNQHIPIMNCHKNTNTCPRSRKLNTHTHYHHFRSYIKLKVKKPYITLQKNTIHYT